MKIDIWSDYVCPFCYLGKRRLEMALDQYEKKDEVEINFHSFELDPSAKKQYEESLHEIIAKKYGIPVEQARASNQQLIEQARQVGLNYNFEDIIPTNTFDAHRLFHFAAESDLGKEFSERVFKAYFVESLNIADFEVLAGLAEDVGLDLKTAAEILESEKYSDNVRRDEAVASKYNVRGVPYFLFNNQYAVSGAQPPETFLEVLRKLD
jgi:predicted DsbA family dithiol-disulfide isomerase